MSRRANLRRLGFASYDEYVRSQHWFKKREEFRASDRDQDCYCCSDDVVQLHHKTYERVGNELLDDLVPLCARCHAMVHVLERRGDIGLDLTGLLDECRAKLYRPKVVELESQAAGDWEETHNRNSWPVWQRVRDLELRAQKGESEARRAVWLIRQKCQAAERRRARQTAKDLAA